jgi:predicted amidophosphoribosyltransferase
VRTRATLPQTELPPRARAGNVRAAFAATNVFSGKRIAIFDDVMTTGQTLHSLAGALRRAGAIYIEAWVVARA